ncbi:alpha-tocopherol transfer protein-like [Dermacentor andersoni]|uniref:alpha-tocopherol transfer protein-like n=1 Tax=Dermacentor andersoni TaxID=34620 RepID=UPI0024170DB0|nr:alpha-tocopherol transfer protein-like [Dermacentor andersoni]
MEPGFEGYPPWQTGDVTLDRVAEESLAELRRLLEGEPVVNAPTNSTDLLRFLRFRKYDACEALVVLKRYCAIRTSAPKLFEGLKEPEKIREVAQDIFTILPQRNMHGKPIMFSRFGKWNPSEMSSLQLYQAMIFCLEHLSMCPEAQTLGVSMVNDFEGYSLVNVRHIELGLTKSLLHYMQKCMPILTNEAHILREPAAFDVAFKLVRPFLEEEKVKAVRFHGKHLERLKSAIPASALPKEFRGTAPHTDWNAFWKNVCLDSKADGISRVRQARD